MRSIEVTLSQGTSLTVVCALSLLVSCAPYRATDNPAPAVPLASSYARESGPAPLPERFWTDFGSAGLTRAVDAALSGNFTLRAAWARLAQANASADIAGAPRYPTLDAATSGRVQRQVLPFSRPGGNSTVAQSFVASLGASYEVDLWQRIGSAARAAALDRDAARDDAEALAITVAAEVAERWFDLARARAAKALMQKQLETSEQVLGVVMARFDAGQTSGLDVSQQQQLVSGTRARLQLIAGTEATLLHQLAVLTGHSPGEFVADDASELSSLPPLPHAGIPSELLQRRPDLRAAQRRVAAADHRIAEAVADRYPALRLGAEGSLQAQHSGFVSQALTPLWNLVAGLTAPIFDGHRRAAEVERRDAVLAERVSVYAQAVLNALNEVENALVLERQQGLYIEDVALQLLAAERAVEQSRERYDSGLTDFLPVLTAIVSAQSTEQALLDARRQLISYRIQLCRALGGTWTQSLRPTMTPQTSQEES